ncbi:MAG TPA: response regulator [Candidatus Bathyarchaeia archaeon]|nr:response regulator [Candidatus Bathyarchaeia archaeon]
MYKVMLVDDDYPVLELVTEAIEWERLGVSSLSTHENGLSAYEQAIHEMPDILITDIGMPKMNGIELTKRLKERNPHLQVAILSCHTEFDFAHQALKLQVQDYLVKDAFEPEHLMHVLHKMTDNLEHLQKKNLKQHRLQQFLDRNKENVKESFLRKTIEQTSIDENEWLIEAHSLGLRLDQQHGYLATFAMVHDYHLVKKQYESEDTLTFSIHNVVAEILQKAGTNAVHFGYGAKAFYVFFPYEKNLKKNSFDDAQHSMRTIQKALQTYLHIDLSFVAGEVCYQMADLKKEITLLLQAKQQRFYMKPGTIQKREPRRTQSEELYAKYEEAAADLRGLMAMKEDGHIEKTVSKWISYLEEQRYPPEVVKEWVLQLLLDLKKKWHALPFFLGRHPFESLHSEIVGIEFLGELKRWLIEYFQSLHAFSQEACNHAKRQEIVDALKYVFTNLEKKISLEEVASHLFLNPSYFSRLFKKEVGETFVEYVTKLKIARAKELLSQTAEPVGKISERLGYDNLSYFIKLFKSYAGVTPIEYRGKKASAG